MENNNALIDAVKAGDVLAVQTLIDSGADINGGDDQGWTPLNYAAGKGDLTMAKLLIEKGADVFKTGRDRRIPSKIALAASRVEMVKYLREVEDKTDPERAQALRGSRKYCLALHLGDLRKFPGWTESRINWNKKKDQTDEESDAPFTDDKIVYIHEDFTVTESMWHNRNVIFDQITDEWRNFCSEDLSFKVPDDLDSVREQGAESEKKSAEA